ncbi:MAG TPA: NF038122 family metalloprotease, partial [Pyrinomonadaceae bacterium]|nr:NF038122 family metalloprotease [Pyrinomonadaceae bacterium]
MSYNLRILGLVGVLTISALGSALPLHSISHLLESASGGSTKSIDETRVKRHASLPLETAVQTEAEPKSKPGSQFTIYLDANNETVCRAATSAERREMDAVNPETLGLRPINHLGAIGKTQGIQTDNAAPNLTIVLLATPQLQQNADATAAFTRAAQNWEAIIKSPITIYIKVDYGTTRFGQPWPSGILGSTGITSGSYPFQSVRTNLIAEANGEGNATKQAIFTSLPSNTVPTDIGDALSTDVSDSNARAIGLLPAIAQSTDIAAGIAFNSNFTFDFNPTDGITPGQIDFDALATHEIGHALGFDSDAGINVAKPSVWD